VKPTKVELSEVLQAIAEECKKIIEMDRKSDIVANIVDLILDCLKNRLKIVFLISLINFR